MYKLEVSKENSLGSNIMEDPGTFFRICTVNINGLDSSALPQATADVMGVCTKLNAHFIGITEVNVDSRNPKARQCISSTITRCEPSSTHRFTSSALKMGGIYKPGGILAMARERG